MSIEKKSKVALAKESTIEESVAKVFELMGGIENMIEPGTTVVLKPNAGHAAPPESSVCTSPDMVRAVIRELKTKTKVRKIIIAEAAAVGCDTMQCFEASGIKAVADEEGVELRDIKADKDLINMAVHGYHSNIKHVKIPRFLLEADHVINLPILKAHASMVFSCALKNIKGVVQDAVHLQMHQDNLTMAMMDVWWAVRADINIVDAWNAAGGYSPHTPTPLHVGCVLGSYDPVAVDLVASSMVGIKPDMVSYFKVAAEVGMGASSMDQIEIVGADFEKCKTKMWVPYIEDITTRWPEYDVRCNGACSSCQAVMTLNMETLKAIGAYEKFSDTVVVAGGKNTIGPDVDDSKLVLHGNCTRKYLKDHPNARWIEGCPPGEPLLYITISEGHLPERPEIGRQIMERDQPVWRQYVDERAKEFYAKHKELKQN